MPGQGLNVIDPMGLPGHWLSQRSCAEGWHGHRGWMTGVSPPDLALPFGQLAFAMLGPPRGRRKTKESFFSHEIYLNLTLDFFQTGTFEGQFHSKLCCLCSSTCWLAMKHQAAKQRSTLHAKQLSRAMPELCDPNPMPGHRVPASQSRTVSTHPQRGETYHCVGQGSGTQDTQSLQKGKKYLQNSWGDGQRWQIPLPEQMSMNQHDLLCI